MTCRFPNEPLTEAELTLAEQSRLCHAQARAKWHEADRQIEESKEAIRIAVQPYLDAVKALHAEAAALQEQGNALDLAFRALTNQREAGLKPKRKKAK